MMACYAKRASGSAEAANAKEKQTNEASRSTSPRSNAMGAEKAAQGGERELKVFFSQSFARRNVPNDFKIGPLADYYINTGEHSSILARVDFFCLSLVENELKDELLDDQNRSLLKESLQYYLSRDVRPTEYRIGLVQINDDDSSHVPVRFLSKRGISEGDIYLTKHDGQWLITDIQVDLQRLEQSYVRSDEEFVPTSYDLLFNNTF
jgi:hypothetical protein